MVFVEQVEMDERPPPRCKKSLYTRARVELLVNVDPAEILAVTFPTSKNVLFMASSFTGVSPGC